MGTPRFSFPHTKSPSAGCWDLLPNRAVQGTPWWLLSYPNSSKKRALSGTSHPQLLVRSRSGSRSPSCRDQLSALLRHGAAWHQEGPEPKKGQMPQVRGARRAGQEMEMIALLAPAPAQGAARLGECHRGTDAAGTCTQAEPKKEPRKGRARLHGKVTQEWCQAANPQTSPAEEQQRFPNHRQQSALPTMRYIQRPHRISPTSGDGSPRAPRPADPLPGTSPSPKHPTHPSPALGPAPWHPAKAVSCTTRA